MFVVASQAGSAPKRASKAPHVNSSLTENEKSANYQKDDINNTIVINVGGTRHEIMRITLQSIPNSRLATLQESNAHYRHKQHEYYFDRHPAIFAAILNLYRTGELHMPQDVCGPVFKAELDFWKIDEYKIEECCWIQYNVDKDTKSTLNSLIEKQRQNNEAFKVMETTGCCTRDSWKSFKIRTWRFLECPLSSWQAKAYAAMTVCLVALSIFVLCAETHPCFQIEMTEEHYAHYYGVNISDIHEAWFGTDNEHNETNYHAHDHLFVPQPILIKIDYVLMVIFTLELIIRFIFCPNKATFFRNGLNIVDMLSILPFYVDLIAEAVDVQERYSHGPVDSLVVLRVLRVFRVLRLLRHYRGFQVLTLTLKHSWKELLLLVAFLVISMLIFASLIYFTNKNKTFSNIPKCFWWAIVTMTTVGYGDDVPSTQLGYLVGAVCSVCGVLVIAFTVPSLVNNFLLFYSHIEYKKEAYSFQPDDNRQSESSIYPIEGELSTISCVEKSDIMSEIVDH